METPSPPRENTQSNTPKSSRKSIPLLVAAAVALGCLLLYVFSRSNTSGSLQSSKPTAPLPQGKAAEMSLNPGKVIVLSKPVMTRLPKNNELGAKKEGWIAEIAYTWKGELDGKMPFKASYKTPKPNERGLIASPAKGAIRAPGSAAEPTFLLPQPTARIRLLIPNDATTKVKKGDKLTLSLQSDIKGWTIPMSNEITLPPLP